MSSWPFAEWAAAIRMVHRAVDHVPWRYDTHDHTYGAALTFIGACPASTLEGVDAMGRGRQKAKQTKVARRLKYYSPETDYRALEKELTSQDRDDSGHEYDVSPAEDDDWPTGSGPR